MDFLVFVFVFAGEEGGRGKEGRKEGYDFVRDLAVRAGAFGIVAAVFVLSVAAVCFARSLARGRWNELFVGLGRCIGRGQEGGECYPAISIAVVCFLVDNIFVSWFCSVVPRTVLARGFSREFLYLVKVGSDVDIAILLLQTSLCSVVAPPTELPSGNQHLQPITNQQRTTSVPRQLASTLEWLQHTLSREPGRDAVSTWHLPVS